MDTMKDGRKTGKKNGLPRQRKMVPVRNGPVRGGRWEKKIRLTASLAGDGFKTEIPWKCQSERGKEGNL